MATLNAKTEQTKKIIHLLITEKCDRNCPYCCNKQYDMATIEKATEEELSECETVFLTGGEPFAYADPCATAATLKDKYPNIRKVFVYTNALELAKYLEKNDLHSIDGLTISIKNRTDKRAYEDHIIHNEQIIGLGSNRVYLFSFPGSYNLLTFPAYFDVRHREWQHDFVPAPDSIFRRL